MSEDGATCAGDGEYGGTGSVGDGGAMMIITKSGNRCWMS